MENSQRRIDGLSPILHAFAPNVYFQPPEETKLKYPCIVYELDDIDAFYADNAPYCFNSRYSLTYITRDPDDEKRYGIAKLPMCKFDRFFTSDNLNHYTYTIYY